MFAISFAVGPLERALFNDRIGVPKKAGFDLTIMTWLTLLLIPPPT